MFFLVKVNALKKLKIIEVIVIILEFLNFIVISLSLPNIMKYLIMYSITEFHNL